MTCHAARRLQPNPILTADAISFPEPDVPATCVPTFGHPDLPAGWALCIRGHHLITLASFLAGTPCPGGTKEATTP